jgi:serine/threonine-protein kinase
MVDRIGHYRIVAELGRGGMGVVYKAHEESLNRFVALKVLGEHLTEDEGYIERFLREARSAAALNHPNIVQVYQVGEEDGKHFFAMEFVTGKSLQQILRESGPMEPAQVARIALQTASGLEAAHEREIIHRDIKPANVLVDERGIVKIADFGLALMGGAASRLTATGMFMGTPGYLSPEQCLDQNVDHRTDIYSLGVMLYEALSGNVPFTADSPLALLRQIVEVEPPDLGELAPDVDPQLRDIVARMMAKDRDLRIASCGQLIGELEGYLETRGGAGNLAVRLASSGASAAAPTTAMNSEIESQPTTAMPSDQQDVFGGPPPPPPPPDTAPAPGPTQAPVVETAPLGDQGAGQGRLALIAVLVVVLGIAAIVVGGVAAWKTGLFASAAKQESTADADQLPLAAQPPPSREAAPEGGDIASEDDAEASESAVAVTGTSGEASAEGTSSTSVSTDSPPPQSSSSRQQQPKMATDRGDTSGTIQRPKPAPDSGQSRVTVPPPQPPVGTGTVVVAVGEELFAREAETVMEEALARAGLELVDEYSIPGASAIISGTAERDPGELHRLLRPHARNAVVIRVEYLGERQLVYMGQRDVAFQSRVTVVPIDLADGKPVQQPTRFRVEYTHLNVERVAQEKLRAESRQVAELFGGR